jgi:hypothetical protein
VAVADELEEAVAEALDVLDRKIVEEALGAGEDRHDLLLDRERRVLPLLEQLDETRTAVERGCVDLSRSEPNCANAASSRYCARSRRSEPATCFIALICALPPTRDTEMPTLMAGRTPW